MTSRFRFSSFEFRDGGRGRRRLVAAVVAAALLLMMALPPVTRAQGPGTGTGLAETIEAIESARVTTRILYVTAHPDDESSSILTYLARGLHAEVALLSLTRGEGGQNALGPEQGPPLGVIRTAELLRATQQYGVRLYFTRAPDFGFSKTPEETLRVWGDAVLDDMVTVLLHFRPHIIINNWGGMNSGHGHHQSAGLLVPKAVALAAARDSSWQWASVPVLQLWRGRFGEAAQGEGAIEISADEISPLWGRSYNEIGLEGFVSHRTQGIVGFRGSRFFRGRRTLAAAGGKPAPQPLVRALSSVARSAEQATRLDEVDERLGEASSAAQSLNWTAAARSLAEAGGEIRSLAGEPETPEPMRHELERAIPRIDRVLELAAGLRLEAEADRSELVAGEKFTVRVSWQRRPEVRLELGEPELLLPQGWQVVEKAEDRERGGVRFTVQIPPDARPAQGEDDWMYPWPPALVRARLGATVEGYTFAVEEDATAQRVTTTRADTVPLLLVPAVTLTPQPRQFVIAQGQPPQALELFVRVHHYGSGAAEVEVALPAPAGWQASAPVKLKFAGAGDQLVKFSVTPPRTPPAGSYRLEPVARIATGGEFRSSLEPLPTLPTRLWSEPTAASVRVFEVKVPRGLRVGYVAAENDPIPAALGQLGIEVTMLDEAALAFGDLQRFDAIAIGIRAYELREDLMRANRRLLDYCAGGGTLLVQYQRDGIWNRMSPAPYAASMPGETLRVAVEDAPVRLLEPGHALLNLPNRIAARDFEGWVQERGLYFWGKFDARYTALLGMNDPGEAETTGSLVAAQHGRGTYIYTGLSFFRQLPAGVPGAYRLLVNLLAAGKKE